MFTKPVVFVYKPVRPAAAPVRRPYKLYVDIERLPYINEMVEIRGAYITAFIRAITSKTRP